MTEDEKYAAALDAALGYFEAAGYTVTDGKLTAAPAGGRLECTATIPAGGSGDHPSFGILTAASEALKSIGFDMVINDLSDTSQLWDGINSGTVDMWCAAWSATPDPDMFQIYHSEGGSAKNYRIYQPELDELVMEGRTSTDQEYRKFVKENAAWLEDYSLYMAIKDSLNGISWIEWPTELKNREKAALAEEREKLAKEVGFYCFQQFCFFKQWTALKAYANAKGVEMIGDIPIYVAFDSADAWAQPELFQFDKENIPIGVAGCPPDAFSATGQLWGNPLYDWEYHKKTGYAWWIRRLEYCFTIYDVVRIDHFRGFDEYYSIPYGDKTAQFGHWEKGPGMDLFRALEKNLGKLDVIAEDLGLLTDSVIEMVEESGFPGMKVLQFAFDENEDSPYLTHRYERNCIVYTGTHDNETTRGWFRNLSQHDRNFARAYIGCEGKHETAAVWSMIRAAMSSVADRCVIPVQDYLCLGNEARINEPSTLGDNWKWRMKKGQLNETIIQKIYKMTKLYGRLVKEETEEKEKTEADREKISDKLSCVYRISSLRQCHKRSRRLRCGISGSGRYFCCDRSSASDHGNP